MEKKKIVNVTEGDPTPTAVGTTGHQTMIIPEGSVLVKKTDLEKWVQDRKDAAEFRRQVMEDIAFVEQMFFVMTDKVGDVKTFISNPLTAITKLVGMAKNSEKYGLDVDRLKAIAEKYRTKEQPPLKIENTDETKTLE
jgi:hypothetical protein